MLHYLPGCDVRKNHPEAIDKLQHYMENQGIIIDRCCRVKDKFLKATDTIIHNCTLCQLILNETYPDNECLSLYEFILEDPDFPWINHQEDRITIQDCWRTRNNLALQLAVRECLKRMNYTIIEMEENYSKTTYCGVWLNNPMANDCVELAPKTFSKITKNDLNLLSLEDQNKRMKQWVQQYTTKQILVYCNGCEKGIKLGDKHPTHLIELLAEGL